MDDEDRELKFENLAVQGNFTIGTRENPFKHTATLSVYGNRSTATMVVSDSVSLGAKSIANFGEISWHGRAPSVQHTKLAKSVRKGDTLIWLIEPVDWQVGDAIVITGTDYDANKWTTDTGSYSGNTFAVLPGVDEVTSSSEEFIIAYVAEDGLSVALDHAADKTHFSGEIDVGFNKNEILFEASNGESRVFAASKITYGAASIKNTNAGDFLGDREVDHGWNYLLGSKIVQGDASNACKPMPGGTYDRNDYVIVVVTVSKKCSPRKQSTYLDAAGAKGMLLLEDDSIRDLNKDGSRVTEKTQKLPTVVLSADGSTTVVNWLQQGYAVALRSNPVVLRASVGNLKRGIVVQGMVDEACTKFEHAANLASYTSNCQERSLPHHLCEKEGFVPTKCYYMKGYGAHMLTGEIMYGSKDEYDDAIAAGLSVRSPKVGQIWATGVEFVNFGKLATTHRGFLINYMNDHTNTENVLDKCVFRHNWQDGVVTGRASGVSITRSVFHRTLGIGISTGDEYVNFGYETRARRSMKTQGVIPRGGDHIIDDNLVSDSFLYPSGAAETLSTHMWQSGLFLRHSMESFKRNVVSGSAWVGISFALQDYAYASEHMAEDNEAYANKYGINPFSGSGGRELFRFKVWKNARAGVVGFDESNDIQFREGVLADNMFGAAMSFVKPNTDFRVVQSAMVGVSDASDPAKGCPGRRVGLLLPRWGLKKRCTGAHWSQGCKDCSIMGNKMDMRFGNQPTHLKENFYVMDSSFSHFGTGKCRDSVGIAINPDEPDYSPDTRLSNLFWNPNSVALTNRVRLGELDHISGFCKSSGSCDAVDYMRFFDEDGSTIGDVWQDGSPDNYANSVIMSDANPAATIEPKCRSDTKTASIVCKNYDTVVIKATVPGPCNTCEPPEFITVHKYGAEGAGQIENSSKIKAEVDPALAQFGLTDHAYKTNNDSKWDGIEGYFMPTVMGAKYNRRTYWTKGAFKEDCSCSDHVMGE